MSDPDYGRANVTLFDPVHVNLRTTRYALQQLGFKSIASMSSLSELKRSLAENTPHMLMMETADNEAEIFRIVHAIRSGELCQNPFTAIIVTSWKRETAFIRDAIGSGADDVIIRPFSTSFAEERIRTLIRGRKPFIVTSDYIGPDRRKDASRGEGAPPIQAPNVLQAVIDDDKDALTRAQAWIEEAQKTVDSERLRRLCLRVIIGAEAAAREVKSGRKPVIDLAEFEKGAREVRARIARVRSTEATRVAQALCEVAVELREPAGLTEANLSLAKELAMAAYVAYAGDDGIERSADEIEKAAGALQKRMANAAVRQAEPNGGAETAAGLKRAAS
jgi:DNA-binding NarL/FixJ family response regulator